MTWIPSTPTAHAATSRQSVSASAASAVPESPETIAAELVAADPREQVVEAQPARETLRDPGQHGVAGGVPVSSFTSLNR